MCAGSAPPTRRPDPCGRRCILSSRDDRGPPNRRHHRADEHDNDDRERQKAFHNLIALADGVIDRLVEVAIDVNLNAISSLGPIIRQLQVAMDLILK